jgi:hypothetical protein
MPYPFSCPQGHVLQADLLSIGQLWQCPVCGTGFLVPAPDCGAKSPTAYQGPAVWPPPSSQFGLPVAIAVDLPPADAQLATSSPPAGPNVSQPVMPGEPQSMIPQSGGPHPSPPVSPWPLAPAVDAALLASVPIFEQAEAQPTVADKPAFKIDLDPTAKAESPFEQTIAEAPSLPRILHIRCPSGHVVKAPRDLLGKKGRCAACEKTFELRYENSIEFQRRTEKDLRREQNDPKRAWLGWPFVAAFAIFAAMVGAVIWMGR